MKAVRFFSCLIFLFSLIQSQNALADIALREKISSYSISPLVPIYSEINDRFNGYTSRARDLMANSLLGLASDGIVQALGSYLPDYADFHSEDGSATLRTSDRNLNANWSRKNEKGYQYLAVSSVGLAAQVIAGDGWGVASFYKQGDEKSAYLLNYYDTPQGRHVNLRGSRASLSADIQQRNGSATLVNNGKDYDLSWARKSNGREDIRLVSPDMLASIIIGRNYATVRYDDLNPENNSFIAGYFQTSTKRQAYLVTPDKIMGIDIAQTGGTALYKAGDKTYNAQWSQQVGGWRGSLLRSDKIVGDFAYSINNGLLSAQGAWDGMSLRYREVLRDGNKEQEMLLTKKDGQSVIIDTQDFTDLRQGNTDKIFEVLEDNFNTDLSFDRSWNNSSIRFSQPERMIVFNGGGHAAILSMGNDRYLQYDSPDKNIHLKVSALDHGIAIREGMYRDDMFTLNLNATSLLFDKERALLGLYTDRGYLVKVTTAPIGELRAQADDIIDALKTGNFHAPDSEALIRRNIKEVQLNFREIARERRLVFADPAWNKLMTSLAWDVPQASFSGESIADIVVAKDSSKALYTALESVLKTDPGAALTAAEKNLSFSLAESIMSPTKTGFSTALGITSFANNSTMAFAPQQSYRSAVIGGFSTGVETGDISLTIPGIAPYGRTALSTTAYAERYYASMTHDMVSGDALSLSGGMMTYVYRFPDPLNLTIGDGSVRNFSSMSAPEGASFNVDQMTPAGTVIPGMVLSMDAKSPQDSWYMAYKAMPYVPLTVDETMGVSIGSNTGAGVSALTQSVAWAEDVRGGVKEKLFGQTVALDAGKDVNDYFFVAPEVTLMDQWSLGYKVQGRTIGSPEAVAYHTGLKTGVVDPMVFWEHNTQSLTDTYGLSLDRPIEQNIYNVSAGWTTWQNNSSTEIVEEYVSAGMNLNNRLMHKQGLVTNLVDENVRWLTSSGLTFGKELDRRISLETDIVQGHILEARVMLKSQLAF